MTKKADLISSAVVAVGARVFPLLLFKVSDKVRYESSSNEVK
jgi:hypothetical protein